MSSLAAVQAWVDGLEKVRADHAEFEKACAGLQQAIDNAATSDDIRKAYQATTRFSEPLAVELEQRYQACLARRERQAVSRRRMIYFGSVAAAVVVLVALGLFTFFTIRRHEASGWAAVLKAARHRVTHQGDLADGQKVLAMVAKAPTDVRNAPAVTAGIVELRNALAADKARAEKFKVLVATAVRLGVGSARALGAMQMAKAMARSSAEKALVTQWLGRQRLYQQGQQAKRDAAFNSAAAALFKKMNRQFSAGALVRSPQAVRRELHALAAGVNLLAASQNITPSLYNAEITSLRATLHRRRVALANAVSDDLDYQKIMDPPASVSSYVAAVAGYVKAHPDGKFITSANTLVGQTAAERAVSAWSNLVQGWNGRILNPHRTSVAARIAALKKYRAAFPDSPLSAVAQSYQAYLVSGLAATGAGGPWRGPLSHVLHNRLLRGLDVLTATNGRRYFVRPGTQVAAGAMGSIKIYQFKAVLSADGSQTLVVLPVGVVLKSDRPKASPQRIFTRRVERAIGNLHFDQWDIIGLKTMRRLKASPMNPVIKGILMSDLIFLQKPLLSRHDARQFTVAAGRLSDLNLENINWLNPKKPPSGHVVRGVGDALTRLPDLKIMLAGITAADQSLARRVLFQVAALGIYTPGAAQPTVACTVPPPDGSSASVVAGGGGAARLEKIGVFKEGHWRLGTNSGLAVTNGSLVFITSPGK